MVLTLLGKLWNFENSTPSRDNDVIFKISGQNREKYELIW